MKPILMILPVALATLSPSSGLDAETIVTVNGRAITKADVDAFMRSKQVPESLRPTLRKTFARRLVERQLMEEYLKSKKIEPAKTQLDTAVQRWKRQVRTQGLDPESVLKKRGLTEAGLRRDLWLPIAWGNYARQIIPDREIRERFEKHRRRFDGTKLRASQIVVKLTKDSTDAKKKAALSKLRQLRTDILASKSTFADAAKKHSDAPSGKQGGDVGFFAFRGTMPTAITRVAFELKKGEVSRPFLTPFGAHLLKVTDVKPGQLSLEDARPEVFSRIAQERWDETIAKLRKSAKIEWANSKP